MSSAELLELGHARLRCSDWAALSESVLAASPRESLGKPNAHYHLSRPVQPGEQVDFFVRAAPGRKKY